MIGRVIFLWSGVITAAELHPDGWRHGLAEVAAMLERIAPHDGEDPLTAAADRLAGGVQYPESEVTDAGA
jgi:hypothetical protein